MMNTSGLDDELLVGFLLKMRIANILRSSKHLLFFKKKILLRVLLEKKLPVSVAIIFTCVFALLYRPEL